MTKEDQNKQEKKRGIPLEDVIAPLIFIVGIGGSIFLLLRFTNLPFWAAAILGAVGFFMIAIGGLSLLSRRR